VSPHCGSGSGPDPGYGNAFLPMVPEPEARVVLADARIPCAGGVPANCEADDLTAERVVVVLVTCGHSGDFRESLISRAVSYALAEGEAEPRTPESSAGVIRTFVAPSIADLPAADAAARLTPRELQALRILAEGRTNREIAEELDISISTVKRHVEQILKKLEASSRTQAATRAVELGLVVR
jgi:DNA-binding NarL/FixJ family response regulator